MKNCLVPEKVRFEEVKSLAPTLYFPKFSFPSLSVDIPLIVSLPLRFLTFPIHSPSFSLPLFFPPYLPCPFCSSVFLSFPLNLPLSLAIFTFPSRPSLSQPTNFLLFSFPTFTLSYLYPSLPLSFPLSFPSPPDNFKRKYIPLASIPFI